MFSNSLRLSRPFLSNGEVGHLYNSLNLQSIRWRRKPRWLPVAPSKLFRIPKKPKLPKEEDHELSTITNNYKTEMKSLRWFFIRRNKELLTGDDVVARRLQIQEDDKTCRELNEKWNSKIAQLREERLAKAKEEEFQRTLEIIEKNKIKAQQTKEKFEAIVRKEKELSKYYITRDNVDEAIEKALSKETDPNFAIDLDGNIYRGRNARPIQGENAANIEAKVQEAVS